MQKRSLLLYILQLQSSFHTLFKDKIRTNKTFRIKKYNNFAVRFIMSKEIKEIVKTKVCRLVYMI